MKRVVICTGGTAGHLFPAQELAKELSKEAELLFLGSGLATSRFFSQEEFPWKEVASGRLSPRGLYQIAQGTFSSRQALRRFAPDVVVGFGSYHSLPPLLAAWSLRIPYVLHAADTIPGRVVRLLAPGAVVTGIHFSPAAARLKGRCRQVAMPLRARSTASRAEVVKEWGLDPERRTLLVFGGSQGARRINELFFEAAEQWGDLPLQLVHMTGDAEATNRLRKRYCEVGVLARVVDFEKRMGDAWVCADLVVSRSGASSLAEQIHWAVPGLLIPFPYAADDHQLHNASYLEEAAGVSVVEEAGLTGAELASRVSSLLKGERLLELREQMESYRGQQRESFADLVREAL